jgi:hypothetical protein
VGVGLAGAGFSGKAAGIAEVLDVNAAARSLRSSRRGLTEWQ